MSLTFSIVIPTYNRQATLRQTLRAAFAQDYVDFEVIVVDDGSTDGTAAMLTAEFPQVRYFHQQNTGPAAARNCGLTEAASDIIAFTDDDCVPPSNWLTRLADGFQRHPEVAGVGGRLLAPPEVRQTNLLAQYEAYTVTVLANAGEQEILDGFHCPAGGTNNVGYRRAALQAVQGFDATFPYAAGEDADLKWRLAQQGHYFLYLPVTVLHLQPYTWPAFCRQQFTRGKGSVYFERKWKRPPSRLKILARLAYGTARWLARTPQLPAWALLRPALVETWYIARGQWAALGEITA